VAISRVVWDANTLVAGRLARLLAPTAAVQHVPG
jgi:hypothetical protein